MKLSTINNSVAVNGTTSSPSPADMDTLSYCLGKVAITLCIFGIFANILSITAIYNMNGNRSAHSKLIISLAASDILVLLTSLLIEVIGHDLCWIWAVKTFLMATSLCATLANLLIMAVDHYVAVEYPMTYHIIMSKRRCFCLIAGLWAFSVIFGLSDILVSLVTKECNDDVICNSVNDAYQMWHVLLAIFFIVLLIIICAYLRIYCIVRHMNDVSAIRHHNNVHSSKTFFTTVLIVTTFAIGWLPHELSTIYQFIIIENGIILDEREITRMLAVHKFTLLLILLNSCADPIIYGFRLKSVRSGYSVLLRRISSRR